MLIYSTIKVWFWYIWTSVTFWFRSDGSSDTLIFIRFRYLINFSSGLVLFFWMGFGFSVTAFALLQSCQNTKSTKEVKSIKKQNSKRGCFKPSKVLWKCAHGVCFVAARICISVRRKLQRTGKIHKRNKKGGQKAPFSSQFERYIHRYIYRDTSFE